MSQSDCVFESFDEFVTDALFYWVVAEVSWFECPIL